MANIPSSDGLARFVRWAIILFFAYALWHSSLGTPQPPPAPGATGSQQTAVKEKDCDKNPQQNFPAFSMPLMPAVLPTMHIEDTAPGAGEPAVCGQTASVRYEYATEGGAVIFSNMDAKAAPENVRIGESALLAAVEQGLIGMKPGGERSITLAASLAFATVKNLHSLRDSDRFKIAAAMDIRKEPIVAKMSLLSLSPKVPSSPMPLRMIDTRPGSGPRAECGDTVTANITIWKLDGTKLFSTLGSAPVTFTLGESEVIPYGIEQGVTGMAEGSERTLIMPPAFTEPLIKCLPTRPCEAPLILPEHEMVLVEMTRLPDVKESAVPPVKK